MIILYSSLLQIANLAVFPSRDLAPVVTLQGLSQNSNSPNDVSLYQLTSREYVS